MDLAIVCNGNSALVADCDIHHVSLDLLRNLGICVTLSCQGNDLPVLRPNHNDIRVGCKLLDISLYTLRETKVDQVGISPVIKLAILCQCERDLVACVNLFDIGAGAQLHRDRAKSHTVIAPCHDLAVLRQRDDVVETCGNLCQLAHICRKLL